MGSRETLTIRVRRWFTTYLSRDPLLRLVPTFHLPSSFIMLPHPILFPSFDGVPFIPDDNFTSSFERPFFRFCHLITAYLSQEKFGPSRLSALIMEWSERLVSFPSPFLTLDTDCVGP